jgi:hypothetical protein
VNSNLARSKPILTGNEPYQASSTGAAVIDSENVHQHSILAVDSDKFSKRFEVKSTGFSPRGKHNVTRSQRERGVPEVARPLSPAQRSHRDLGAIKI